MPTREKILSNRRNWPIGTVRYQQFGHSQYDLYRPDCSGGVGMCLELVPPGPNTEGLVSSGAVRPISWSVVLPGDVIGILGPGTGGDAGHVQLLLDFNAGKDHFFVWEQTPDIGPSERWYSLTSLINDGFAPYRPTNITPPTEEDDMGYSIFKDQDGQYWLTNNMVRRVVEKAAIPTIVYYVQQSGGKIFDASAGGAIVDFNDPHHPEYANAMGIDITGIRGSGVEPGIVEHHHGTPPSQTGAMIIDQ